MPDKMFELADREGILVGFFNLPWGILGAYYRYGENPPVILLHKKINHQWKLLRCVLAEELGHHFTTAYNLMAFTRVNKQYMVQKYERSAIFWAVDYLMPLQELIKITNSGIFSTYEIAEYFDVTTRFAGTGIRLYIEKKEEVMRGLLKELPEEVNIGF